ncbi:hypothetical protein VTL71DRAFT_6834 [Oculimacula yallundae]|uniref:Uncharacterized protein n=1 Tax=Oculimacula yallundae TaxID=86028 RepID=A0ABR4BVS4_9HELO
MNNMHPMDGPMKPEAYGFHRARDGGPGYHRRNLSEIQRAINPAPRPDPSQAHPTRILPKEFRDKEGHFPEHVGQKWEYMADPNFPYSLQNKRGVVAGGYKKDAFRVITGSNKEIISPVYHPVGPGSAHHRPDEYYPGGRVEYFRLDTSPRGPGGRPIPVSAMFSSPNGRGNLPFRMSRNAPMCKDIFGHK